MTELPKDAEGKSIPLDTEELYTHYGERGTGFCDCQKYRDRYEKLEGDELERTFCSEIRGTRYCKYEELH